MNENTPEIIYGIILKLLNIMEYKIIGNKYSANVLNIIYLKI